MTEINSDKYPLFIPSGESLGKDHAFDKFLKYVEHKNLKLYDAQEEAIVDILKVII